MKRKYIVSLSYAEIMHLLGELRLAQDRDFENGLKHEAAKSEQLIQKLRASTLEGANK